MDEKEKKKEDEVTPEGAVELDEKDLDAAAGGSRPYSKIEVDIDGSG